jgi:hypothetical protein
LNFVVKTKVKNSYVERDEVMKIPRREVEFSIHVELKYRIFTGKLDENKLDFFPLKFNNNST